MFNSGLTPGSLCSKSFLQIKNFLFRFSWEILSKPTRNIIFISNVFKTKHEKFSSDIGIQKNLPMRALLISLKKDIEGKFYRFLKSLQ